MKRIRYISIILSILIIVLLGLLTYINYRDTVVSIFTGKDIVEQQEEMQKEKMIVTYSYGVPDKKKDIEIIGNDIIEKLQNEVLKKTHEKEDVKLAVIGVYTIHITDEISISYDEPYSGYVLFNNGEDSYIIRVEKECIKIITEIVDDDLLYDLHIADTNKIVVESNGEKKNIIDTNEISKIMNISKDMYTEEIKTELNLVEPDYKISFDNEIIVNLYDNDDMEYGYLYNEQEGKMYKVFNIFPLKRYVEDLF